MSGKCRQIVRKHDTGTLRYDIFTKAEESEATVVEEYVDAQAPVDHSTHIGDELSAAIMATASVHGELLGELSDEFRAQLKGSPVQPFAPFLCMNQAADQSGPTCLGHFNGSRRLYPAPRQLLGSAREVCAEAVPGSVTESAYDAPSRKGSAFTGAKGTDHG